MDKTVAQNDHGIIKTDQFPIQQFCHLMLVHYHASKEGALSQQVIHLMKTEADSRLNKKIKRKKQPKSRQQQVEKTLTCKAAIPRYLSHPVQ